MREQPFLDPGQEDSLELEPLGGVERHERDRPTRVVELIRRRDERHLGEEVEQRAGRIVAPELPRDGHELFDVFGAGLVLRVPARTQRLEEGGSLEQGSEDVGRRGRVARRGVDRRPDLIEDDRKPVDRSGHLGPESELAGFAQRLPQREVVLIGMVLQCGLRRRPDPALRHVHDAAERERVGRVGDGDEVGERILDLGALVELRPADDPVGQRRPDEDILERTRLRIGAVEDRHVAVVHARLAQLGDLVGDELGLVVLAVTGEADDLLAVADVGEELLVLAVEVVRDDSVRGAQDVLRRPVVLFEQHDLRPREVPLELHDVPDVGTAERVDRLVGVAHDSQ